MTYIRKILKKLKVYDETDISDIETAIKNLSVKVSLFLYDVICLGRSLIDYLLVPSM